MIPDQPGGTVEDPAQIGDSSLHETWDTATGGQGVVVPALDVNRMTVWMERYRMFAVAGVRSRAVAAKIALHLERFRAFFQDGYGHDRQSICLQRESPPGNVRWWSRAGASHRQRPSGLSLGLHLVGAQRCPRPLPPGGPGQGRVRNSAWPVGMQTEKDGRLSEPRCERKLGDHGRSARPSGFRWYSGWSGLDDAARFALVMYAKRRHTASNSA